MSKLAAARLLLPTLVGSLFVVACGSAADSDEPSPAAGAAERGGGSAALAGTGGQRLTSGGADGVSAGQGGAENPRGGAGGLADGGGPAGTSAGHGGTSGSSAASGGRAGNNGSSGNAGASNLGGSSGNAGASNLGGASGMGMGGSAGSESNTDYLKTRTNSYGFIQLAAGTKNQILSLSTTLTVPAKPSAKSGTLFLWPGLQPGGANYQPIDNGVLQPVLTWGPTCAPNAPSSPYSSWWISGQYVNTYGMHPGYTDCHGGEGMSVNVGDELAMVMKLSGTVWQQTINDHATQKTVSYEIDMLGQAQNYAEFDIEIYSENPVSDVIFTNTQIVLEQSQQGFCQPTTRGINDFFTNPHLSADGKTCSIERIVLRAKGVPATSPN